MTMLGESLRRRQPGRKRRDAERGPSRSGRWKPLLWALPVAMVLPFFIGYALAVYVIFPPAEATGAGVPVPELVGRSLIDAHAELAVAGLGDLDVTELPHPTAAAGVVVAQSPLAGQQLRPGAGVSVAVSRGRPQVLVPDVAGFAADRATVTLRRAGFEVVQTTQESTVAEGRVLRTEPAAGAREVLPATITLFVSAGPPPEPEPFPPDTLGPPPPGEATSSLR
jgi:eukaryotic-like serine/threonine-protein kinase